MDVASPLIFLERPLRAKQKGPKPKPETLASFVPFCFVF